MATSNFPFGLRAAVHPSGIIRQDYQVNGIVSGYGTAIYTGTPVKRDTNGTLIPCATGADTAIGVFQGVEYTDATGRFVVSPFWPASATYRSDGQMQAYFTSDPNILYDAQANGPVAATKIGEAINLADASQGSDYTGLSSQALNATTTGATPGLATVVSIPPGPYFGGEWNTPGDAYTIVRVRLTQQPPIA